MAVAYGPRRFNALTAFMILCGLGAGYWCWRFFPAYFDGWTVDHALREAASGSYKAARLSEPTRSKQLKLLVDGARETIVQKAHVTDPDLLVNMDLDGDIATVSADYSVVITHPYINKTTTLHFHRTATTNTKRVDWD
jgi:hypothetical protein